MNVPDGESAKHAAGRPRASREPSWRRTWAGLIVALAGLLVFTLGVKPGWFGLDRSPVVGFVQISVFLVGLAVMCVGGYVSMQTLWGGRSHSIVADFGLRLVATGYVIAVVGGLADALGVGSQARAAPYLGPVQAITVEIGELVIAIGFLMFIPYDVSPSE